MASWLWRTQGHGYEGHGYEGHGYEGHGYHGTSSGFVASVQNRHLNFRGANLGFGSELAGLARERMDLASWQNAGFGARSLAEMGQYKQDAYQALFTLSGPIRMKMLLAMREMLKEQLLADPDMWFCVRRHIEETVDDVWTDIIFYEEKIALDRTNALSAEALTDHASLATVGVRPMRWSPLWLRAKLLYCMLPFDRSIFGQLKDPLFFILTAISLVPVLGIRIIYFTILLCCILRGCPPDEFQLVNYILAFKGTQVLSSGVFMSTLAAIKYYLCVHPHSIHSCSTAGPGVTEWLLSSCVDMLGSCVLVWVAFVALPFSVPSAGMIDMVDDKLSGEEAGLVRPITSRDQDLSARQTQYSGRRCCNPRRGGRLGRLLLWELCSFGLSCFFFLALVYLDNAHLRPGGDEVQLHSVTSVKAELREDMGTWQFKTALFFTRVFYAWLSFPFLIFKLPLAGGILTRTSASGYNKIGYCVPRMLPPLERGG